MKAIVLTCFALMLMACTGPNPRVVSDGAHLTDEPAAAFDISGWSYTNTSNPFILTPDRLTNALLGISRLRKGEKLPASSVTVPGDLSVKSIADALRERLKKKQDLFIGETTIAERTLVIARYTDGPKTGLEYAFEFEGYLAHIVLIAKPGAYFSAGEKVAFQVVRTFRSE